MCYISLNDVFFYVIVSNNTTEKLTSKSHVKDLINVDVESLDVPNNVKDILRNAKAQVINTKAQIISLR